MDRSFSTAHGQRSCVDGTAPERPSIRHPPRDELRRARASRSPRVSLGAPSNAVSTAAPLRPARARRTTPDLAEESAHVRCPGDRSRPETQTRPRRVDTWTIDIDRAGHDDQLRPAAGDEPDKRELQLHLDRGGKLVRVQPRRRRICALHKPEKLRGPERESTHLRGESDRRSRQYGSDPGDSYLDDRHDCPEHEHRVRPADANEPDRRKLHLQLKRGGKHVRMPPRRRRVRGLSAQPYTGLTEGRTRSGFVRPTRPATPTRSPQSTPGRSTRSPRTRRSHGPPTPTNLTSATFSFTYRAGGHVRMRPGRARRRRIRFLRKPEELRRPTRRQPDVPRAREG